MKRPIYFPLVFLSSLLIFIAPASAKNFEKEVTHDPQKVWEIEFNSVVEFNEDIKKSIYIETESGQHHPVNLQLSADGKTIKVHPDKPFFIEESYSLIITEDVYSVAGTKLNEETIMPFEVQGEYIQSVQVTLNPLVTNVQAKAANGVARITISINGGSEIALHEDRTRGIRGLMAGDEIQIFAYDQHEQLLEKQSYQVLN
ncbi:Ig-like domain-containing protein [Bacillus dakarensis]|uniref:Ig-like domain-containing protein n=1 Tax=Robertmurraya dakarensis TaxID=1926278 RepID=UPI0009813FC6|nr:hypothetical protein [Bacillus dakarensis]